MTRPLPRAVRIYRVGGSVRDELLGRSVADHDFVVVGATPEMMVASEFMPVGRDFPVFLHPETREEYALARTERKHGRGYRGFEFFATPEVTLEDDLRRRDLTINAMARGPDGALIDPHGGEADLRARVLRHVSPAFAEDPLRVLRVARFAARFDFRIADETLALMRDIVASGELTTLAPERVWQEFARGLGEAHPSRLLRALRACGALAALLPQIDALYAIPAPGGNAGAFTEQALDWAARHALALPARYAVALQELDRLPARAGDPHPLSTRTGLARAAAVSAQLKAPVDCRDAAQLAVRWHRAVAHAGTLQPAALLAVISATDALRRPERLELLLASTSAHLAIEMPDADASTARVTALLRDALGAVRGVDAAAIARAAMRNARDSGSGGPHGDAIGAALRRARLAALRQWKRRASAPGFDGHARRARRAKVRSGKRSSA
jgi:tRNA nucleotidyltransferase (CCA-adding enzyme)